MEEEVDSEKGEKGTIKMETNYLTELEKGREGDVEVRESEEGALNQWGSGVGITTDEIVI